eukprot:COSAG06_NODE_2787_length_6285_cov_24.659231_5_plen_110_part_00
MPAATRRATRDATNLLTATPDEAALLIACALNDARDLLRLAAVCRRFFIKCIAAPGPPPTPRTTAAGGAAAAEATEMWSYRRQRADGSPTAPTRSKAGCLAAVGRAGWV